MKKLLCLLATLVVALTNNAASPSLRISSSMTNSIQIDWNSTPGTSYEVLGTTNADSFALWSPVTGTITATGTNTTVVGASDLSASFFKLHTVGQANSGMPSVRISSHTNGETVSGLARVSVSAGDDSRLSYVSLYVDGKQYEGSIADGDLYWMLNTGAFSNGLHTLQAVAADNVGDVTLGGSAGSSIGANISFSTTVTLNFTNVVQWIEPEPLFVDVVPMSMRSAIYPTNWTVYVENEAGDIVRTFTGFTSDGVIETQWDGKDQNGNTVPDETGYRVLFVLGELPPPSSSSQTNSPPGPPPGPSSSQSISSASVNKHGTWDYTVTQKMPLLPSFFSDPEVKDKVAKGLLPPLPFPAPGSYSHDKDHPTHRTRKVSVLEASAIASASTDPLPTYTNDFIVWKEPRWWSGETLLARQKFNNQGTLNATFASNQRGVATMIDTAVEDDARLANRIVYGSAPSEVVNSNDFAVFLNDLSQPIVRNLWYIGHSSGNGIGYSEQSPNYGITTRTLSAKLQNFSVRSSPKWGGRWLMIFRHPYRFVFLDGCASATGPFHEAFGIVDFTSAVTDLKPKKRAYMGWPTPTKNSLLNTSQANWSFAFWQAWVDIENANYDVTLTAAITAANARFTIPVQPKIIGFNALTWADPNP